MILEHCRFGEKIVYYSAATRICGNSCDPRPKRIKIDKQGDEDVNMEENVSHHLWHILKEFKKKYIHPAPNLRNGNEKVDSQTLGKLSQTSKHAPCLCWISIVANLAIVELSFNCCHPAIVELSFYCCHLAFAEFHGKAGFGNLGLYSLRALARFPVCFRK